MGIEQAIIEAIEKTTGADILIYAGVWAFSPLLSHTYIRLAVNDRDRRHLPEASWWVLLAIAVLGTFAVSFAVSWGLGAWPIDKALKQSLVVAMAYPMLLPFLLRRARTVAPDLAGGLGELPTEFRAGPDDPTAPR